MHCCAASQPSVGKDSTFQLIYSPEKRLKVLKNSSILKLQKSKGNLQ